MKKQNGYVDVYLMVLTKKNLPKYKKMAEEYAKIVKEYGALECREFIGDDLPPALYPALMNAKKNEVIITSVIGFLSKTHRNTVNKKVRKDERMVKMMNEMPLFDMSKMMYGGFKTFVQM